MTRGEQALPASAMPVMSAILPAPIAGDGTLPSLRGSSRTMTDITGIADRDLLPAPKIAPGRRVKTGGRAKGTLNRVTADVRAALRELAENNAARVQDWLDRIAKDDPAEALRLYLMLIRYVVPVLSAAAIADITPRSPSAALAHLSDDELLACIIESPSAAELVVNQRVRTKDELLARLTTPAISRPGPSDEELLS
jgi:hypothetical protein